MKPDPRAPAPPSPADSFKTTDTWEETPWGIQPRSGSDHVIGYYEASPAEQRELERQAAVAARNKGRKSAGIPPRVLPLLDALKLTEPVAAVRAFMADQARSLLVLAGPTGCGKTVAACLALDLGLVLEVQGPFVRPTNAGEFLKAIDLLRIDTFDSEPWENLGKEPVLVIDDLGTEPLDEKGWGLSKIAALLDDRYDGCRKTVITTNLTGDQFKARYRDGGRLADRLREAGSYIQFSGQSLRRPPSDGTPAASSAGKANSP